MNTLWYVAERNGKKGPGKVVTIVATETEAKQIKDLLDKNPKDGIAIVTNERPMTIVDTVASFTNRYNAEQEKTEKLAKVMAKLTPEEMALIGK